MRHSTSTSARTTSTSFISLSLSAELLSISQAAVSPSDHYIYITPTLPLLLALLSAFYFSRLSLPRFRSFLFLSFVVRALYLLYVRMCMYVLDENTYTPNRLGATAR